MNISRQKVPAISAVLSNVQNAVNQIAPKDNLLWRTIYKSIGFLHHIPKLTKNIEKKKNQILLYKIISTQKKRLLKFQYFCFLS